MDARLVVVLVAGAEVGLTGVYSISPWSEWCTYSKAAGILFIYLTVKPNHLRSSSGNTSIECVTPVPKKAYAHATTVSHSNAPHTEHNHTHLELIPKHILGVRAPWVVRRRRNSRGRVPKHPRPLLDSLVVVLDVERLVGAAVVDLHLGPGPSVTRVHILDDVCPLLLGPYGLARRARRVPEVRGVVDAHETARGDARVGDARREDVGVCRCQDVLFIVSVLHLPKYALLLRLLPSAGSTYRHHSTRRYPRSKHPTPVRTILRSHKVDHVSDRITRAATAMRERHLAGHIPAVVARVRRLRVDDHKAVRLRVPCPLAALVVGLGAAAAPVDADDDGGLGGEVLGHVEPHPRPRGVGAVVGHLGECRARHGLRAQGEGHEGQGPEAEEG